MEVSRLADIFQGMIAKQLYSGRYAVFTHRGGLSSLMMTYEYIWGTWVPCSGYELDLRDDFELYDDRFLGRDDEKTEIDIFIPVK